jgi:uncharacterized membrane protein
MRHHRPLVCLALILLVLLLIPLSTVHAQNYFEYNVQIQNDGSAVWTITQFSGVNDTVESWDNFQQRVFNLVDTAQTVTHREMSIDVNTLQINTTISFDSKITEFQFVWQNFSIAQGSQITVGDVFGVSNFFGQLYGDAKIELTYPVGYSVVSVNPPPYQRQDSTQTLTWSRSQDLANGPVNIVLSNSSPNQTNTANRRLVGVVIVVLAVVIAAVLVGFYFFRRKKKNRSKQVSPAPVAPAVVESEEAKVLKLLKSTGGSMRQSQITDALRFSKAKTSQLLSSLEKKGDITRYKNGRDKIVTLKERAKSE